MENKALVDKVAEYAVSAKIFEKELKISQAQNQQLLKEKESLLKTIEDLKKQNDKVKNNLTQDNLQKRLEVQQYKSQIYQLQKDLQERESFIKGNFKKREASFHTPAFQEASFGGESPIMAQESRNYVQSSFATQAKESSHVSEVLGEKEMELQTALATVNRWSSCLKQAQQPSGQKVLAKGTNNLPPPGPGVQSPHSAVSSSFKNSFNEPSIKEPAGCSLSLALQQFEALLQPLLEANLNCSLSLRQSRQSDNFTMGRNSVDSKSKRNTPRFVGQMQLGVGSGSDNLSPVGPSANLTQLMEEMKLGRSSLLKGDKMELRSQGRLSPQAWPRVSGFKPQKGSQDQIQVPLDFETRLEQMELDREGDDFIDISNEDDQTNEKNTAGIERSKLMLKDLSKESYLPKHKYHRSNSGAELSKDKPLKPKELFSPEKEISKQSESDKNESSKGYPQKEISELMVEQPTN